MKRCGYCITRGGSGRLVESEPALAGDVTADVEPSGRVTRLVGAVTDITQRKLREEELRRARDEATRLFDETQRLLKETERRSAELAVINGDTTLSQFKQDLRNNEVYYHLAQGIRV